MLQLDHARDHVVTDTVDQVDRQKRLSADKLHDQPRRDLRIDVAVILRRCRKQHIAEGLGDLPTHNVLRFIDLVAVGAAEVAGIRDLPGYRPRR